MKLPHTPAASAARLLCAGALAACPIGAAAQDSTQRVEITGSSIKRIDGETALPVQIIDRKAIERSGAINVEQLLQSVTAMASSGGHLTAAPAADRRGETLNAIQPYPANSQRCSSRRS